MLSRNRVILDESLAAVRAREDFLAFRWFVCGHRSFEHHIGWTEKLNTNLDSPCLKTIGGENTLLLAPRGSSKSTYLTEWAAWVIGKQTAPEVRLPIKILYTSYNIDVATLKSIEVKRIIETPEYREVFPWVRPSKRWSDKLWEIDRSWAKLPSTGEPYTVACAGLTGAVNSKRAHLVLLDDLIKSPKDIENPKKREEMDYNWSSVISKTMFEGARAVCLGTRMSGDDIYCTTFTEERDWQVIEESAIVEDETTGDERSYWPPRKQKSKDGRWETAGWSLKFFQEEREDDPVAFAFQRQNKIASSTIIKIAKSWIKDGSPPVHFDELAIGLDLAASLKQTADFTVFVLVGKAGDDYWILDMRRGKWAGNIDKVEVLIELCLDWGILETDSPYEIDGTGKIHWGVEKPVFKNTGIYCNIFAEAENYQVSFKPDFVREIYNKYEIENLTVVPTSMKGDKLQKLRSVSGVFQNGHVYFNKYRNLKIIKTEITEFAQKDDAQDGTVLALHGLGARTRLSVG